MRKSFLALLAMAVCLALGVTLIGPANALSDESSGSSCTDHGSVVKGSANFNDTQGPSPVQGYLDYLVLTSPIPLLSGGTGSWSAFNRSGTDIAGGYNLARVGSGTNPYTYRTDPNVAGITKVRLSPVTGGGYICTMYLYPHT
jgi:hypothetical protein